jgi:hypothetical protein
MDHDLPKALFWLYDWDPTQRPTECRLVMRAKMNLAIGFPQQHTKVWQHAFAVAYQALKEAAERCLCEPLQTQSYDAILRPGSERHIILLDRCCDTNISAGLPTAIHAQANSILHNNSLGDPIAKVRLSHLNQNGISRDIPFGEPLASFHNELAIETDV